MNVQKNKILIDVHLTNVSMYYSLSTLQRQQQPQQDVENIDRILTNVVLMIEKEMDTMDYYYYYPMNVHHHFSDSYPMYPIDFVDSNLVQ